MISVTIKTDEQLCIAKQRIKAMETIIRHQPVRDACDKELFPAVDEQIKQVLQNEVDVLRKAIQDSQGIVDGFPWCPVQSI